MHSKEEVALEVQKLGCETQGFYKNLAILCILFVTCKGYNSIFSLLIDIIKSWRKKYNIPRYLFFTNAFLRSLHQALTPLWKWACPEAHLTQQMETSWNRCWLPVRRQGNGRRWSSSRGPRTPISSMSVQSYSKTLPTSQRCPHSSIPMPKGYEHRTRTHSSSVGMTPMHS